MNIRQVNEINKNNINNTTSNFQVSREGPPAPTALFLHEETTMLDAVQVSN